ncbi:hypothetical protein D3C73_718270 [compost metagenome]
MGSADCDKIRVSFLEQTFREFRLADDIAGDHRNSNGLLHGCGEMFFPPLRIGNRLNNRIRRFISAAAYIYAIHTKALQVLRGFKRFIQRNASRNKLIAVNADRDREPRPAGLLDAEHNLRQEQHSALKRTTVFIGSQIRKRT